MTACDLELTSFASVDSFVLFLCPYLSISKTYYFDLIYIFVTLVTFIPLIGSSLKFKFSSYYENKSLTHSL